MSSVPEIVTHRQVPEEWPNLTNLATAAIPFGGRWRDSEPLRELGQALVPLDREGLDTNLYYAYSLAICGLARSLHDPENREKVVGRGARIIIEGSSYVKGGISGLRTGNVDLALAFKGEISQAYLGLPQNVKLLGNFIRSALVQRRDKMPVSQVQEESMDVVGIQLRDLIPQMDEFAYNHTEPRLIGGMKGAIDASAHDIIGRILAKRTDGLGQGELPDAESLEFLRHPTIRRTAQKISGLMSAESFGDAGEVMEITDEGVFFVDPYSDKPRPRLDEDEVVDERRHGWRGRRYRSRDKPIFCPAAHVNDTLPLVLDIVVEMVDQACDQLSPAA